MPTPPLKTLLLLLGMALVLTGCPDKKPKGGSPGPKPGGNKPPAQPKKGKPSNKGANDDLQADAKNNNGNQLNEGEERTAAERERQRDGLSQTPPTDVRGATSGTQTGTQTGTQPPNFGQLPPTTPNANPNLQTFGSSADPSSGGPAALPGLPSTKPTPPQPRGVRGKKTH